MKVYFVRHGQSEYNVLRKHHHQHVGLTKLGSMQAKTVARRLKKLSIDVILSSNFKRASQTAEIIAKELHRKVDHVELFHEIITPSQLWSEKHDSEKAIKIKKNIRKHIDDPAYHYSNEENFFDVINRAKKAWDYLSLCKQNHIVVVTHESFLRVLIIYLLLKDRLRYDFYERFSEVFKLNNASITLCEKTANENWYVIMWNS